MLEHLDTTDKVRRNLTTLTTQKHKSEYGQFITPANIARFMASLFSSSSSYESSHLLDAGAGIGTLSCAFLDRWITKGFDFKKVEVTAYEVDEKLQGHLYEHLNSYDEVTAHIINADYIEYTTQPISSKQNYTHAILNPPYRKIKSKSKHRLALRRVGIETVNLYSGFIALALSQMITSGQLVAIIPRSFCNGPYYRPFREFLLENAAIHRIHLFKSRNKAFKDDQVLQENIIIHLERGAKQGSVIISTSTDDSFSDLTKIEVPFERIVFPNDPLKYIHIQTSNDKSKVELSTAVDYSIENLGLKLSTGPVVDFRMKDYLRKMPEEETAPLIYPAHFKDYKTTWPLADFKKNNAIIVNEETKKWLYPSGFYCVVKRFSSKEEKRRIVASLINPANFESYKLLGFENHLNVFHINKAGLPEVLARGLMVYLNTTAVDDHFRRFSGHTQVNATDLKQMKYPSRDNLIRLGEWSLTQAELTQENIDTKFGDLM